MHYRNDDTTGRLIKTSLRYTQVKSGLAKPFYTQNFYKFFLLTPTWLTNLWQYCSESHVQLRETKPWIYEAPRDNDFFLMTMSMRSNISQEQKEIFNRMRLNLKLLTAADIVLPEHATKFDPNILFGINKRNSDLNWPKQMQLSKK